MAQAVRYKRRNKNRIGLVIVTVLAVLAVALALAALFFLLAKPEIALNGDAELKTGYGQAYDDPGVKADVLGKSMGDKIRVEGQVDTSRLGDYVLTYSMEYWGKVYSVQRTVHVVDLEVPEITLNGERRVSVHSIGEYQDAGASAVDDCDGDLSAAVTSVLNQKDDYTYEQIYTVTDQAGNQGTAVREIVIADETAPVVTLNGDAFITIQKGDSYSDAGATAADDRDGDLSSAVQVSGSVDPSTAGTYTITYTVQDAAGNEGRAMRHVTVASDEASTASRIYLTFDDGPSSDVTARILDILKENGIKATFFICNYSEDKIPLLQRMVNEGHTIGIHGYSHEYSEIYTSTDAFMENIDKLWNKLKEDTGYEAFIIRFPGGSSNTVSRKYCTGIMTELVQMVTNRGLLYLDWNVDSNDATKHYKETDYLYESVTSALAKNRTNVVLMHDLSTKTATADVLQKVIDYGRENGYTFYACSPDMTVVHHGVNN